MYIHIDVTITLYFNDQTCSCFSNLFDNLLRFPSSGHLFDTRNMVEIFIFMNFRMILFDFISSLFFLVLHLNIYKLVLLWSSKILCTHLVCNFVKINKGYVIQYYVVQLPTTVFLFQYHPFEGRTAYFIYFFIRISCVDFFIRIY